MLNDYFSASSLGISRKKSVEYTLKETGPHIMIEKKEGRLIECTIPTEQDDLDITTKLMHFIEHKFDKKLIKRAEQPFAEGGQRISYHGKLISTDQQNNSSSSETIVMKRFKEHDNRDGKQQYIELMETQYTAAYMATEFNKVSPAGSKEIRFLKVRGIIF